MGDLGHCTIGACRLVAGVEAKHGNWLLRSAARTLPVWSSGCPVNPYRRVPVSGEFRCAEMKSSCSNNFAFAVGSDVAHLRVEALLIQDVIRGAVEDAAIPTHAAQVDLAERLPVIGFADLRFASARKPESIGANPFNRVSWFPKTAYQGDSQPRDVTVWLTAALKQPWDLREPIRAEVVVRPDPQGAMPPCFPDPVPLRTHRPCRVGSE